MNKVYCGECRFFKAFQHGPHGHEECMHPDNQALITIPETYRYRSYEKMGQKKQPFQINSNNECGWFEPLENVSDEDYGTGMDALSHLTP